MRALVGAAKLTAYLCLTLLLIPLQWIVTKCAHGAGLYALPLFYHRLCCRIFGIKVLVEGVIHTQPPVVYMSNHLSYLDISVIGSILPASFMAKKDVARWPLFGTLARLQKTLFVSRNPRDAATTKKEFEDQLKSPLPLVIFPEGTSSNGSSILPFKTSLFESFLKQDITIQPFTISLLEINGRKPSTDALRDLYAYHGDISLPPHLWNFSKLKGCVLKLSFQEPVLPLAFDDRKFLSLAVYKQVSEGLDLSVAEA